MLYTKKFVITVSLCAMLAVNPVLAVTDPVSAVAGAKSGTPGVVSTVYSDWAGRATSGIAGVSYVNSAVDAAGNAAQWAENHAAIAAQNAASAAKSASDAAGSAADAHDTLKKAVQRSSETAAVGSATLPVYVKADGTVETITSYQGKATTAGTADKAIADKNGAQIDTTYEKLSNKVTALSANSTDTQYPSAKVVYTELGKKQGTISDLTTIRSGAAAGATAVQPEDLSEVATSGSYTDLSDKPTIGSGVLTIKRNGTSVGTFNANATGAAEINITDNDTKYTLPAATSSTLGGVKQGTNITIASDGTISAKDTTYTAGTNVTITNGVISAKDTVYTLPAATSDTLGGVKTGTNITNSSGTISVATANGTTLGVVKQGTNTTISNGAVNVATANGTTLGVVKQGTNTTISSGAVNVATANGTTLGVVKQGTNTTISNGAVNVANATATVAGVSKLGVIPVAVDGSKTGTAEIWVE